MVGGIGFQNAGKLEYTAALDLKKNGNEGYSYPVVSRNIHTNLPTILFFCFTRCKPSSLTPPPPNIFLFIIFHFLFWFIFISQAGLPEKSYEHANELWREVIRLTLDDPHLKEAVAKGAMSSGPVGGTAATDREMEVSGCAEVQLFDI